jgi:hypothetical protein
MSLGMSVDVIARMRGRVEQVRRVLELAHDPRMIEMLEKIIAEGEADIAKLEAERTAASIPPPIVRA